MDARKDLDPFVQNLTKVLIEQNCFYTIFFSQLLFACLLMTVCIEIHYFKVQAINGLDTVFYDTFLTSTLYNIAILSLSWF